MGSFSIWHWLIVLLVVVLIFGTKKLKNIGSDLGGAVKGFKDGMREGGADAPAAPTQQVSGTGGVGIEHRHHGDVRRGGKFHFVADLDVVRPLVGRAGEIADLQDGQFAQPRIKLRIPADIAAKAGERPQRAGAVHELLIK